MEGRMNNGMVGIRGQKENGMQKQMQLGHQKDARRIDAIRASVERYTPEHRRSTGHGVCKAPLTNGTRKKHSGCRSPRSIHGSGIKEGQLTKIPRARTKRIW